MDAIIKDMKYGNFVASEHNLVIASFNSSTLDTEDLGMGASSEEEYIGKNSIPLDFGSKYQGKQSFSISFIKNTCTSDNQILTDKEIRAILREMTGKQYYEKLYLYDEKYHYDEQIHYKAKVTKVDRTLIGGDTIGLTFTFECDSFWTYSDEMSIELDVEADKPFYFYNSSDDLYNYLNPTITITFPSKTEKFMLTNVTDNNRRTIIKNVEANEITILSAKWSKITSSIQGKKCISNFNLIFPKFISGENVLISNTACHIKIDYQLLRKRAW